MWALGFSFGVAVTLSSSISHSQTIYLTWQEEDTSRTMTVVTHSTANSGEVLVHYGPQRKTSPAEYPHRVTSDSQLIPGTQRRVHFGKIQNLTPGTEYYFMVTGAARHGGTQRLVTNKILKFKTVGASGPVRFVLGGDMEHGPETDQLSQLAAKTDPEFALVGGDIAYDDGIPANLRKWDAWLDSWTRNMVTSQGHLVPIVAAVGNHEVLGGYGGGTADKAPFYFGNLSPTPDKKSYFTRRFGKDLVIHILDSGHIASHGGAQTQWLQSEMTRTADAAVKLALYHVPLYPSVRAPNGAMSVAGRKFWGPVFEKFGLTLGLENHDHALKRTKFIQGGRIDTRINPADPRGVAFIGDGCWGKEQRPVDAKREYLEVARSTRHFWSARLDDKTFELNAIDSQGGVADRLTLNRTFLNAKRNALMKILGRRGRE